MSVSIIIPCLNRADELERCLRSFSRVPESEEFNVIVVDDGSAVPLESTVRNHPFAGVVRNEKRQGAAALHSLSGMREYPLRMRARRRAMVWLAMVSSLAKAPEAFRRRLQLSDRRTTERNSPSTADRTNGR